MKYESGVRGELQARRAGRGRGPTEHGTIINVGEGFDDGEGCLKFLFSAGHNVATSYGVR